MRRREFITLLGGATAAWPLAARAQQSGRIPRIGVLWAEANAEQAAPMLDGLRQGLGELTYFDGQTIKLENRFAGQHYDRFDALAAELVENRVDVLVASVTAAATAARRATKTIPIVFAYVSDPVASKIVDSLAHPGANATGLSWMGFDVAAKQVEILKEAVPNFSRLAILQNPDYIISAHIVQAMEEAADRLKLTVAIFEASKASELDLAFHRITQRRSQGLLIVGDPMFFNERNGIADLALANHLPTMAWHSAMTGAGALMSYGPNITALFRRAAFYVDKILKGAKPADLPVEQPTKFDLVINLKTAKALGLEIPPTLLARADEFIE